MTDSTDGLALETEATYKAKFEAAQRVIDMLKKKLDQAKTSLEKRDAKIVNLQAQLDELRGNDTPLAEDIEEKLKWLKESLTLYHTDQPISEENNGLLKDLSTFTDTQFEALRKKVTSVAYLRYAIRKKEYNTTNTELFKKVFSRAPRDNELKVFERDIRVGELLLSLTEAVNKNVDIISFCEIIRQPLAIKTLAELGAYKTWVCLDFSSSHISKYLTQEMLNTTGVPSRLFAIVTQKRKRTEGGDENRPAKKKK